MKQQVLKALANPAHIFYVPYSLAVLNFAVQFIVFCIIFAARLIITGKDTNPLFFMVSFYRDIFKTRPTTGADNICKIKFIY